MNKKLMTSKDVQRIQRSEALKHGGVTQKGTFSTRAQSAVDKRESLNKGTKKS